MRFLAIFLLISALHSQKVARDFSLKALDGKNYTLSKLYQEKPVVMDFWATWCRSCGRALKELQNLWFEADRNFHLISVNEDLPSKYSRVKSLVKSKKWKFPVLLDSNGKVKSLYKVMALPTLFVIDTSGKIVYYRVGYSKSEVKDVKEALKKCGVEF